MRVALLCPGPSLAGLDLDRDKYDCTIGVNRAALQEVVGWWVFLDWRVFMEYQPPYRPRLLTTRACATAVEKRSKAEEFHAHERMVAEDLFDFLPHHRVGWTLYSATTALVFAAWLGAKQVDAYGADMHGTQDYDGHTSKTDNRTDKRWATERALWGLVCDELKRCGIKVKRYGPA